MIRELPAGYRRGDDNGLKQEPAGETVFIAAVDDRLLQLLFGLLLAKLRCHFLCHSHGLRGIFLAVPAVTDKLLAILRVRFSEAKIILSAALKARAHMVTQDDPPR